jgi:uncharacterized protein (DUF1015 family)
MWRERSELSVNGKSKYYAAAEGLIRPFAALRPTPEHAADVIAAPYDVLTVDEARQRARLRPWSFLHVSMPEVDLPPETARYAPEIYAKATENMARMMKNSVLRRDPRPSLYLYRLTDDGHAQTGIVAATPIAAYDNGRVCRHELTRPDREDDRVRQMEAVNAHTGPVMLAHPPLADAEAEYAEITKQAPDFAVTAEDGIGHELWSISDPDRIERLRRAFDKVSDLYIADGHHRCAAASRVAARRRAANPSHNGDEPYNDFLAVVFPSTELRILGYNRVVLDLGGLDNAEFLARLAEIYQVAPSPAAVSPARPHETGMYLDGRWYRIHPNQEPPSGASLVSRLDITVLSQRILEPILGIGDPRSDSRIEFVGGGRGLEALERRVDSGAAAIAFSLYPTRMEDLMAVADAGEVMPPKSTWFEPKLADGLVSYSLD